MPRGETCRHSRRLVLGVVAGAGAAALAAPALAGPDWNEIGDAGSFGSTAQVTFGPGTVLNSISGALSSDFRTPDFEDMYIIRIVDPATFTMRINNANFNAQLFLFNITLPGGVYGLLSNDDRAAGDNRPLLGNMANDPSGAKVTLPGDYAIAVSGFNNDPLSSNGLIFNAATPTEISGADGPGGLNNHIAWTGFGETGNYLIELTGAGFPDIPAPGSAALVAAAGGLALRRRRR